jgi:hypothetical protein
MTSMPGNQQNEVNPAVHPYRT